MVGGVSSELVLQVATGAPTVSGRNGVSWERHPVGVEAVTGLLEKRSWEG